MRPSLITGQLVSRLLQSLKRFSMTHSCWSFWWWLIWKCTLIEDNKIKRWPKEYTSWNKRMIGRAKGKGFFGADLWRLACVCVSMERFGGSGHRYVRKEATIHSVWSRAVQLSSYTTGIMSSALYINLSNDHRFQPFLKKTFIHMNLISESRRNNIYIYGERFYGRIVVKKIIWKRVVGKNICLAGLWHSVFAMFLSATKRVNQTKMF